MQQTHQNDLLLSAALVWLAENGVDSFLEAQEAPWVNRIPYKPKVTKEIVPPKQEQEKYIDLPEDLETLYAKWKSLMIPARHTATHFVQSSGVKNPEMMIIGETPSAEEDRAGEIYAPGPRQALLSNMLKSIDVDWEKCFFSYVLPWRPPGNRGSTIEERKESLPFLLKEIELVQPKMLLLLGGMTGQCVLGKEETLSKLQGKLFSYSVSKIPTMIIPNLDAALSTPTSKKQIWQGLLRLAVG